MLDVTVQFSVCQLWTIVWFAMQDLFATAVPSDQSQPTLQLELYVLPVVIASREVQPNKRVQQVILAFSRELPILLPV